ncbi:TetR/AcrR family transcriptional regulator [Amycolatopsis sp. NPDC049253]|uniref:TetR/AcrR family transcriptional regulator n=1 Tax=Amycolatopsis sp. NPDC049253 TaxID=3155274 RepID=UPI00341C60B2
MTQTATARLTARGQATRDRIVSAAAQLMAERGVAGTSTPDVRDAAGVSSSQIYHYFADKGALTRAVIEFQTTRIVGGQHALLSRLDSFAALRAWRDALVQLQQDLHCEGGCPLATLSGELAEHDADARAALAYSFTLWAEAIRDGLQHMIDHGVLREDTDAEHLSLAMLAALQGGLVLAQAQRSTKALEAGLDSMIAIIERHAPK